MKECAEQEVEQQVTRRHHKPHPTLSRTLVRDVFAEANPCGVVERRERNYLIAETQMQEGVANPLRKPGDLLVWMSRKLREQTVEDSCFLIL